MIVSRLAYNCNIEIHSFVGTNGMGEKVYRCIASTRGYYATKAVREKSQNAETSRVQYTIQTVTPLFNIGDLLIINDKHRVIVSSVKPDSICEVIAYDENPNAF